MLTLGETVHDLTYRALVMGIVNRTPDSFYDRGATWEMDAFLRRAEDLVDSGADILDVGGVKAGPGPEVTMSEELGRVIPAIAALHERFDVPLSVDTWRAEVAREAYSVGAVVGNDISGFSDPKYLPYAAEAGAAVVATHIRLAPRVPDPEPYYHDVVTSVRDALAAHAERALANGIAKDKIILDAGLDLGKTHEQSLTLLRGSSTIASLGYPLLLSASNKPFFFALGLEIDEREAASVSAAALGVALGSRILRVHDVDRTRQVRDVLAHLMQAV
ncbi:MAG TPA: dihydropteroate synthase [Acidimicrobiales bacterium]|nr:dihydropteroate synthase [Acidimicrobiales bacterium]